MIGEADSVLEIADLQTWVAILYAAKMDRTGNEEESAQVHLRMKYSATGELLGVTIRLR